MHIYFGLSPNPTCHQPSERLLSLGILSFRFDPHDAAQAVAREAADRSMIASPTRVESTQPAENRKNGEGLMRMRSLQIYEFIKDDNKYIYLDKKKIN